MYADTDLIILCHRLTLSRLTQWVDQGWITPHKPTENRFNDLDRTRADLISYLLDDLDIQENAIPVILSLLDQVYGLRGELRVLTNAVADLSPPARNEVVLALKESRENTS